MLGYPPFSIGFFFFFFCISGNKIFQGRWKRHLERAFISFSKNRRLFVAELERKKKDSCETDHVDVAVCSDIQPYFEFE